MKTSQTAKEDDFTFDKRLYVVFLIIFTEVLGFSIALPLIPYIGKEIGLSEIQLGLIFAVFSFCQFFAAPITGKLSDYFGRKPLFILSQISTFIGFIVLGFANTAILLIIARLIDGLFGSNMTVSQAYISDITKPKHRTRVFSYSSAVFGAGLIFGPSIQAILSSINYSIPMFFSAGITLISIILVIFLPETISKSTHKISIKFNDIFPLEETKRYFRSIKVRNKLIMFFVYNFGFQLFISGFSLFAIIQFNSSPPEVGLFLSWIGITRVIIQTLLISRMLRVMGENRLLISGIISMVITMVTLAFSTEFLIVLIPLIFLSYGTGVSRPILMSKMTNSVIQKDTASVIGISNGLNSIAQIVTPIAMGTILEYYPSQTLPLISGLIFISLFLFLKNESKKPLFINSKHKNIS